VTTYPTRFTVGVRTHQGGTENAHGNDEDSWSDPVDWAVYAVAPAGTLEPFEANRAPITWDLDVLGPVEGAPGSKDLAVWQGVEYKVEGRFESFDFGPFGFAPGGRVRLKRVEG